MITEDDPNYVTALARGLSVLRALNAAGRPLTNSEVAQATGLTRATARRLLLTMASAGYLHCDGRNFSLSPRVMDLGMGYFTSKPIWEIAQPVMKRLVDIFDESCSLSVLDGNDAVYIARVPPKHMITIPVPIGTRIPAFVNAMGRVMLANLPQQEIDRRLSELSLQPYTSQTVVDPDQLRELLATVRAKDYALALHEMHEGRGSIAVPVRDKQGNVHAAMNIAAMLSRVDADRLQGEVLTRLREAAHEIGNALIL